MPACYKNLGVAFDYPENWIVREEETVAWPRQVSLQSSDTSFWMLQIHHQENPRELAALSLKTMKDEYEELEAEPVTERIEDVEVVGFDMDFYCLDFLIVAKTRSMELGNLSLLVMYQGEDRDFGRLEPVFHAITVSLLRHAKLNPQ